MSDRFFTYEMQHIFPREIQSSTRPEAQAARDLLSQIGFDLETLGNKIALLTQGETIAAYNDAPPEIWAALEAAGFGRNRHDSQSLGGNHPGYNKFLIDTLAEIKLRSDRLDWSPEARELAVYDLHRLIAKINKDGTIPIIGSDATAFTDAWNAQGGILDYQGLLNANANSLAEIRDYRSGYDLHQRSNNPIRGERVAAEAISIHLYLEGVITESVEWLMGKLEPILKKIGEHASAFVESVHSFGETVLAAAAKSTNQLLVGLGGSVVGDVVEFLNAAYDPFKKGVQTGDWSDFGETIVQIGAGAALSVVLVTGSIVATAAIVGIFAPPLAPIAAAFVGAAWAAIGLYDAIDNGIELFEKIVADLAEPIRKVGEAIDDILGDIDRTVGAVMRIVGNALDVDFTSPVFGQIGFGPDLVTEYVVDSVAANLPGYVEGSSEDERFFGRNSAVIEAGGGDDELFVRHSAVARGGEGNDIVAGANARFVKAGDPIDPANPDSPVAETDLRMMLDGGEGNDVVVNIGGEGAIAVGGEGSDLIYISSYKGQLWGDGLDGRGPSYTGNTNDDTFWWSAGSFIMDAGKSDRLQLFGLPLVGGTNSNLFYGIALEKGMARDFLLPWVTYGMTESGQLLVEAGVIGQNLDPSMSEEEIGEIAQVVENWEETKGKSANDNEISRGGVAA